tara:strand:- start:26 stop:910 length:885 start_codon:yes stop_codon:yes gene_type:complete
MKKSLKYLAILLVILMPLSAFAESWWSPDRVRINLRIGGSDADGGIGEKTMKFKCPDPHPSGSGAGCTSAGLSSGDVLATAGANDKETERAMGGFAIHYIMDMGMIVGLYRHTSVFNSAVTQSSNWAASTESSAQTTVGSLYLSTLNSAAAGYGPSGTALAVRQTEGYVNFLDLGYFYDLEAFVGGMSVSGGIGLPLLGAGGKTTVVYGSTGYNLNGNVLIEEITADEGSASTFFVDLAYAFGTHEALFGIRSIKTSATATVSTTKGLGKILGEDKFTSDGNSTAFSLGYGYIF